MDSRCRIAVMYTRVLVYSFALVQCGFTQDFINLDSTETASQEEPDDGRIVGGYETTIEEHPYQVSLRYRNQHFCGGALIAEDWVLTAGHCVATMNIRYLTVMAGSTDVKGPGQVKKVQLVIAHDNYTRRAADYDIALLHLESPLEFSSKIQSVDLPDQDEDIESRCFLFCDKATVTGWGVIESKGEPADRLRAVSVPLVSNSQCAKLYSPRPITERMLCAGHVHLGGKDACQGDSGGPLVRGGKLIGVVSWGLGCAKPRYPGVYTRVPVFRLWISENSGL